MPRTEKLKVEDPLVRAVECRGGKCRKFESPGRRGAPDRIVVMPDGWVCFVETKAPSGRLDAMQEVWRDELVGLGANWRALHSREEVRAFEKELDLHEVRRGGKAKAAEPDTRPGVLQSVVSHENTERGAKPDEDDAKHPRKTKGGSLRFR